MLCIPADETQEFHANCASSSLGLDTSREKHAGLLDQRRSYRPDALWEREMFMSEKFGKAQNVALRSATFMSLLRMQQRCG